MITKEQAYLKAVEGLASQGFIRSVDRNGYCMYRKNRQKDCKIKCAIGWLIPDERYSKKFEGNSFTFINWDCEIKKEIKQSMEVEGLENSWAYSLQGCHDKGKTPDEMKAKLRQFGKKRGYKIPEALNATEKES